MPRCSDGWTNRPGQPHLSGARTDYGARVVDRFLENLEHFRGVDRARMIKAANEQGY